MLLRSLKKYGWNAHKFEIIETINSELFLDELLNSLEVYWISFYKSNYNRYKSGNGLNLTDGGKGTRGYKHREETIEIFKKINSGAGNPNYGKKMSEEQKEKISKAQIGAKNWNYGRKASLETRLKQSIAQTGKKRKKGTGEKISKALTGKKHSEETKKKLSQSRLGKLPSTCKKVLNTETNIIYNSIKDAAKDWIKSEKSLANRLNGKLFNDTSFIYL